jgi:hypothetical protein
MDPRTLASTGAANLALRPLVGRVVQRFLRAKVSGNIMPERDGRSGYPLYGGAAWGAGRANAVAPVGHTFTAQVVQAARPKDYGAGQGTASPGTPAVFAGATELQRASGAG